MKQNLNKNVYNIVPIQNLKTYGFESLNLSNTKKQYSSNNENNITKQQQ